MTRATFLCAGLLAIWASPALAQVIVTSRPVVTYYAPPAPVVTYSPTVYSSPVVAPVVSAPVNTYYAPAATYSVPTTTYYAPTTTYYAPTSTYYAPAPVTTFYGGTVVAPTIAAPTVVGRPVVVGRSLYGTLTPYVPGQPIRNALRFTVP